jgi:preprotein translocase subunit SecA
MFLLGFSTTDSILIKSANLVRLGYKPFENSLIQVGTGEGKSVVLGLLATILALFGYSVDVAGYSAYLSKRDYESFTNLFTLLKIKEKISYGTFIQLSEKLVNLNGDIRVMC